MSLIFVDSNVFLRLFTRDDEQQYERSYRLFSEAATGAVSLVTGPPVLFDLAWRLRTTYKMPREAILDVLRRIVATPGLELVDRALVEDAVALADATGQEFADAYVAASTRASGADAVATFNREHFEKLGATLHPL